MQPPHRQAEDRRLSARIRALLSGERSDLRSARFVQFPREKRRAAPSFSR
jgi:hypothetical protein